LIRREISSQHYKPNKSRVNSSSLVAPVLYKLVIDWHKVSH
jgi:hypothetical protein